MKLKFSKNEKAKAVATVVHAIAYHLLHGNKSKGFLLAADIAAKLELEPRLIRTYRNYIQAGKNKNDGDMRAGVVEFLEALKEIVRLSNLKEILEKGEITQRL